MKTISELMNLKGRVAVITGGAGKIAEALEEGLAELGADLAVLDISLDRAQHRCKALTGRFGIKTAAVAVDVAQEDAVHRAVAAVERDFGRIDILINNAAYPPLELPEDGRELEAQQIESWRANLDVMLTGCFLMTRACTPLLRRSGKGCVLNFGSIYGLVGPDLRLYDGTEMGNPAYYAAAKGGIVQLTRYWASTLAPAVRVNCICPGGVWRDQPESFHERYKQRTPLQRMAVEEDLKGSAAYLVSDLSAYVTGQILAVDGGWTAW